MIRFSFTITIWYSSVHKESFRYKKVQFCFFFFFVKTVPVWFGTNHYSSLQFYRTVLKVQIDFLSKPNFEMMTKMTQNVLVSWVKDGRHANGKFYWYYHLRRMTAEILRQDTDDCNIFSSVVKSSLLFSFSPRLINIREWKSNISLSIFIYNSSVVKTLFSMFLETHMITCLYHNYSLH